MGYVSLDNAGNREWDWVHLLRDRTPLLIIGSKRIIYCF